MSTPVPFSGADAAEVKRNAAAARAQMTREIESMRHQQAAARADLEQQRAALEAEFRRKQAEMEALMAPMQAELAKMQEVAWTVDLYLGRDEQLELIRDGEPAPAETPITIRQRVLVMAEESLVLMGQGRAGVQGDDVGPFLDWLTADPANLDRLLPEPRGVVVLVANRVKSDSGNMYEDASRDATNSASWWLIRNGERLYLLTVDPQLRVTERLLPRRDEFTEVFGQRLLRFGRAEETPVVPGSEEWLAMEARADARRRHYMRIMLVLQGIVDRTPAWHPLPFGGVNLLSVEDQDRGKIVLIQDAETSIQLGDGHESFADYQRRLNALMRPGLRLIGDWGNAAFNDLARDWEGQRTYGRHPRLHPETVGCRPEAGVPHLIEDTRAGGFVIRYHRTDTVYRRDVPVPDKPGYLYRGEHPTTPTQRASCIVMRDDTWVLPYDLVTVADLRYFLNSRDERSRHFLSMVPVLRSALAAKEAEAAMEAPFRDLLTQILLSDGADEMTVSDVVDDLVHWWKVKNTWARPLNGDPAHEKKAIRDIRAEQRARVAHAADDTEERMVSVGRDVPGALAVTRDRKGTWRVYTAALPAPDPGIFLHSHTIAVDGTIRPEREWMRLQPRTVSTLHVAWQSEAWARWNFAANPNRYLTGPERDQLVGTVADQAAEHGLLIAVVEAYDPARSKDRYLTAYVWRSATTPETAPLRSDPHPLRYTWESGKDRLIEPLVFVVTKTPAGVSAARTSDYPRDLVKSYFGGYTGAAIDVPWWDRPEQYEPRPRLAHLDEDMFERLTAYVRRCETERDSAWEARRRFESDVYRYVEPLMADIRAAQESEARARFDEDFGPDAADLWPAHLSSLKLLDPVHPRTLWGIIAIALHAGETVVGRTLADLAESAHAVHGNNAPGEWHPSRGVQDLGGFGHLIVGEPE